MGEFGARDGQAGSVRARRDHQLVIRIDGSRRGLDGLAGGVDAGDALAGLEVQGRVVPHGSAAQGEVDVAVGECLAQRDAVIGEVGFLGEDGNVPAIESAGVHGIGETVRCGAAAGHHNTARGGAGCALVRVA